MEELAVRSRQPRQTEFNYEEIFVREVYMQAGLLLPPSGAVARVRLGAVRIGVLIGFSIDLGHRCQHRPFCSLLPREGA